jgi:serine/threonine protein kinase
MTPGTGQRVGEYILETKLGAGTFGEVWRAHHHVWVDQLVAIKIPTDGQYLRDLQREGVAIRGLVHPNIVRAIGFDPYADPPYLIMEYVPGTSLRAVIGRGGDRPTQVPPLQVHDAVAIMRQVLCGLRHAHANNIVHRDIKPENILVHERARTDGYVAEGVIKITDFGLGRAANAAATASIVFSASMNTPKAREIAGTLDYMAPEQRGQGTVDARADLYACGVVLYEMLTGERPAGTEVPSDLNPAVPKYLDEVFRRSYARLEKRFAAADEFLAALPGAAQGGMAGRSAWRSSGSSGAGCPRCRQPVDVIDQFCMHCGVQLVSHVKRCQRCGAYPDSSDQYCIFCGEELAGQLATAQG